MNQPRSSPSDAGACSPRCLEMIRSEALVRDGVRALFRCSVFVRPGGAVVRAHTVAVTSEMAIALDVVSQTVVVFFLLNCCDYV